MLMFSGLQAQGEINRLLDELYGGSEQAYSSAAKGRRRGRRGLKSAADSELTAKEETNEELGVTVEVVTTR